MAKGWQKISSKIIHQNPWYRLREDDVIRPNGTEGKYFLVDGINSVAVIAEDSDERLYLVGQSRYPIGNLYSWEIITGGVKQGLDPLVIAKQELEEEAGVVAGKWTDLGYVYPINGYASERCSCFLAQKLTITQAQHEDTEDISIRKENLDKIIEMIRNNKITCGISIATVYKYLLYKNKFL
ncbi:MAG: NUDIX hydrolase [Patescibacteria group bacterium]|jgi:8-oxo-dGTP pyrophosphatase MutT (NUDIX family)